MKVSGIHFVQGRNYSADTDGKKYGIAIHNTSNNASAEDEASYATRRTDSVSSHFYADKTTVIQSLDTSVKAWHAGSANGNNHAIAVEITGVNSWTRAQWLANVNWDLLGKVLAQVCKYYGIPAARVAVQTLHDRPTAKGFYSHDDMRRAWGGTTHTDPGPSFPWDKLFSSVKKYLEPEVKPVATNDDSSRIQYIDGRVEALASGRDTVRSDFPKGAGSSVWLVKEIKALSAKVDKLAAAVEELKNRPA